MNLPPALLILVTYGYYRLFLLVYWLNFWKSKEKLNHYEVLGLLAHNKGTIHNKTSFFSFACKGLWWRHKKLWTFINFENFQICTSIFIRISCSFQWNHSILKILQKNNCCPDRWSAWHDLELLLTLSAPWRGKICLLKSSEFLCGCCTKSNSFNLEAMFKIIKISLKKQNLQTGV